MADQQNVALSLKKRTLRFDWHVKGCRNLTDLEMSWHCGTFTRAYACASSLQDLTVVITLHIRATLSVKVHQHCQLQALVLPGGTPLEPRSHRPRPPVPPSSADSWLLNSLMAKGRWHSDKLLVGAKLTLGRPVWWFTSRNVWTKGA